MSAEPISASVRETTAPAGGTGAGPEPAVGHGSDCNIFLSQHFAALQALNAKLLFVRDSQVVFQELVDSARQMLGSDCCAIFVHAAAENALQIKAASGSRLAQAGQTVALTDEGGVKSQAFREEYLVYVSDLRNHPEDPHQDPEMRSELCIPISCQQGPVGLLTFGSRRVDAFGDPEIRLSSMLANQTAFTLDNLRLFKDLTATRDAVIRGMALLAESRDGDIGGHLDRICAFSRLLAEKLAAGSGLPEKVDEEFVETIYRSAALHDIGKVGIPDSILRKPGKLSGSEFEVMKTHTTIGGSLLDKLIHDHGSFPTMKMGAEVAHGHHEWWDGNGYPRGLQAQAIPLSARIVALADVFDALTSRRVYKGAWSCDEALETIAGKGGSQFDPDLVQVFLDLHPRLEETARQLAD